MRDSSVSIVTKLRAGRSGVLIPERARDFSIYGSRDSVVGIATRYGLDVPGLEPRLGRDFSGPSRPVRGPPSCMYNGYWVSFLVVRRSGRASDHPPPSSADVWVEVYLYLHSVPVCHVMGQPLSFYNFIPSSRFHIKI